MDHAQTAHAGDHIISKIVALAPFGVVSGQEVLDQLKAFTQELIALFKTEGRLDQNPAALALNRTVELHADAARACLQGCRVMVTGGAGCVGSRLIPLLASLGATEIAIVDIATPCSNTYSQTDGTRPTAYQVDIRDTAALNAVFEQVKPQVVFHLAGIREPGRAESVVRDAIETNVFGTGNLIEACLTHGVEDAVYSSTGKCFAYISDHVYTASKKLAEAQWVAAARNSASTRFRCTRFTHIMENGLVAQDIAQGIANGLVGLHGPDRYFNIQNLRQATHLLVNALALAKQTPPDGFWSAVDLGWPVNTLELALYSIDQSPNHSISPAAICFMGVPKGYDEAFFRGQFPWGDQGEYHPLINALEAPSWFGDSTGSMVGARAHSFTDSALQIELEKLRTNLQVTAIDMVGMKQALADAVMGLARSVFGAAELSRLIDVLWSGAAPTWAGPYAREAERFCLVIGLLTDAVVARISTLPGLAITEQDRDKLMQVCQTLSKVDRLHVHYTSLSSALAATALHSDQKCARALDAH